MRGSANRKMTPNEEKQILKKNLRHADRGAIDGIKYRPSHRSIYASHSFHMCIVYAHVNAVTFQSHMILEITLDTCDVFCDFIQCH